MKSGDKKSIVAKLQGAFKELLEFDQKAILDERRSKKYGFTPSHKKHS